MVLVGNKMKLASAISPDELATFVIQARLALLDDESGRVEDDEPFFVADLGQVYRQHQRWTRNLPAVQPFYGPYGSFYTILFSERR